MPNDSRDFAHDLAAFSLSAPDADWRQFESVLPHLTARPWSHAEIVAALGVFERHPHGESFGLFWTLLHGLEAQPDFEPLLFASVRRVPSEFGVTMLGRLLNADTVGLRAVPATEIRALLSEVLQHSDTSDDTKEYVRSVLTRNA